MATNILQQVITYNESGLALLLNSFAFINEANKKFLHFNDDIAHNLGDTVSFDLPPKLTSTPSLVITFQPAVQRIQQLTVDRQRSVAIAFTAQQFIFNVRDYIDRFGRSGIAELGSCIEADTARVAETNTFRFWGDGTTPISTSLQLAQMLASFRNMGGG